MSVFRRVCAKEDMKECIFAPEYEDEYWEEDVIR